MDISLARNKVILPNKQVITLHLKVLRFILIKQKKQTDALIATADKILKISSTIQAIFESIILGLHQNI